MTSETELHISAEGTQKCFDHDQRSWVNDEPL